MRRKLRSVAGGNGTHKAKRQDRFPVPAFSARSNKPRITLACGTAARLPPSQASPTPKGGVSRAQEQK